jgi:hypothetical protein
MRYFFIPIFFLLLVGCKKQELDTELEKAIQQYQAKVQIPQSSDLKDYLFVYVLNFSIKNQDTIINITRWPSGVPEKSNCFGIYQIGNSYPVVIYDDNNLGGSFIKEKVRNNSLQKYKLSERKRHFVDYPPVYSYVIKKDKINFVRVDTISDNWKK